MRIRILYAATLLCAVGVITEPPLAIARDLCNRGDAEKVPDDTPITYEWPVEPEPEPVPEAERTFTAEEVSEACAFAAAEALKEAGTKQDAAVQAAIDATKADAEAEKETAVAEAIAAQKAEADAALTAAVEAAKNEAQKALADALATAATEAEAERTKAVDAAVKKALADAKKADTDKDK